MHVRFTLSALCLGGLTALAAPNDPVVIDLGGIRQATGTVVRDGGAWLVTVQMTPIGCFSASAVTSESRQRSFFQ